MKKINSPEFLFSITGFVILLIGLTFFRSKIDIVIHDTYIIISQTHIVVALCLLFLFFSLIYFLFKKGSRPLYKALGLIHYILMILPLITTIFVSLLPGWNRVYKNMSEEMENMEKFNITISISILLCLLGQLLFVINIITTLLMKKPRSNKVQ